MIYIARCASYHTGYRYISYMVAIHDLVETVRKFNRQMWKKMASATCFGFAISIERPLRRCGWTGGSLWEIPKLQQQVWARTFARAVAGTPLNMTFDVHSGAFDFCFVMDRTIQAPSEIYASRYSLKTLGIAIDAVWNLPLIVCHCLASQRLA